MRFNNGFIFGFLKNKFINYMVTLNVRFIANNRL